MARLCFALVVVVCVSAVLARSRYAYNQRDEIDARLKVCLAGVRDSGFHIPSAYCRMTDAKTSLLDGKTKESLTESVAACLKRMDATDTEVATAKACMAESLPKDLQPAIPKIYATANQRAEMAVRIDACLVDIPNDRAGSKFNCRSDSLLRAQSGYPKEYLTDLFIVPCLRGKNLATEAQLATAQSCLLATLAKPLNSR